VQLNVLREKLEVENEKPIYESPAERV